MFNIKSEKSKGLAYLAWLFLGLFGIHRMYTGNWVSGIIWLLTCGLFGIGWLFDLFLTSGLVDKANMNIKMHNLMVTQTLNILNNSNK